MSDVVDLQGQLTNLKDNQEFVADCCRFQEGILTEARMKLKYGFADGVWEKLGNDTALLEAVEDEKTRRIRSGQQKREKAQQLVVKAPAILDGIMSDPAASPRHRVDAIKTLDSFTGGPENTAPADRFQIVINLGADVQLKYDRSRTPDPNDAYDDIDTGMIAAIAAKKPTDGGNGQPV